jgi:hypothetical protein
MKRALGLSLLLTFAIAISAQASVVLNVGDTVKFDGQVAGEYFADGGAFDWTVTSAGANHGADFFSFCIEIQENISAGSVYTVTNVIAAASIMPGVQINSSGYQLNDTKGIFLFDQWSQSSTLFGHATNGVEAAKAVQIALWESEGYDENYIYMHTTYGDPTAIHADETLANTIAAELGWTTSWLPIDVDAMWLSTGGVNNQDQVFLIPQQTGGHQGTVPEPASVAIWGLGICFAGVVANRRRISSVFA